MSERGTHHRGRRLRAAVGLTALLMTVLGSVPAWSSENVASDASSTEQLIDIRGPVAEPNIPNYSLGMSWVPWHHGARVFGVAASSDHAQPNVLLSLDARTGEVLASAPFTRTSDKLSPSDTVNSSPRVTPTMLVDEAAGRLLLLAGQAQPHAAPVQGAKYAEAVVQPRRAPKDGTVMTLCDFCHLSIRDARSLELIADFYLTERGLLDRPMAHPRLLAATYEPGAAGGPGKVLLVAQERVHDNILAAEASLARQVGSNTFLIQWDTATGATDWALRLDACRATNMPSASQEHIVYSQVTGQYPAGVVFRMRGEDAIIVGCHVAGGMSAGIVRVPLRPDGQPAALPVHVDEQAAMRTGSVPPSSPVAPAEATEVVYGPTKVVQFLADPQSGRVLLRALDYSAGSDVWLVYDTASRKWMGSLGMTPAEGEPLLSTIGFSAERGRLYVANGSRLYVADVRGNPLPQALVFPLPFADRGETLNGSRPMVVIDHPGEAMLWVDTGASSAWKYMVAADRIPAAAEAAADEAMRSLDLDEVPGATSASFDGTARGYGARLLLVNGAEGAARAGSLDGGGWKGAAYHNHPNDLHSSRTMPNVSYPAPTAVAPPLGWGESACVDRNREAVIGFVGPGESIVVDASGSRGTAKPVVLDQASTADAAGPVSRCADDWERQWKVALMGQAPAPEPGLETPEAEAACLSDSDEPSGERVGDATMQRFSAAVQCEGEEAHGYAYARGLEVAGVSVGEALSSFRIYRDPSRGMVSRVESVARGIMIEGVGRIATVRGTAEAWANGRRQPAPADSGGTSCDFEQTAGTCFQRHLFGVSTHAYRCGPCGDEAAAVRALDRALGANGSAALREPDPVLAAGAADGSVAAIQKSLSDRFADAVINQDLLPGTVPVLEITRRTQANRPMAGGGNAGKQIVQLAGVEVSSNYAISCLLEYDPETGVCAPARAATASLQLTLTDAESRPLPGGGFELRSDSDADGILGLADELVPDGVCVTADDGVGTCQFERMAPGSYLVTQSRAPAGHSTLQGVVPVTLEPGDAVTLTIVNVSEMATVEVQATRDDGSPLAGAGFAVYEDPDSDGKVAPDALAAGECTTDSTGTCTMRVPAGPYVLVQTRAAEGLAPIEPVAFTLSSGGQTATAQVVNYPSESAEAAPIEVAVRTEPPPEPTLRVAEDPAIPAPEPAPQVAVSLPEQLGGTVVKVIRAPGDALRLLSRDPRQAAAWITSLALFAAAGMASARRMRFQRALAFDGPAAPPAAPRPGPVRPGRPPTGGRPRGDLASRPQGSDPASPLGGEPAASGGRQATALLDAPPTVAGAAPSSIEEVHARVLLLVADEMLAAVASKRLAHAERCDLVETVCSVDELPAALERARPDVLVVDLGMRSPDGTDLCGHIAQLHDPARSVGLVPAAGTAKTLMRRGYAAGLGAILAAPDDLANGHLGFAVRCVAAGKICYGPTVQEILVEEWEERLGRQLPQPLLSPRELEVANLAASGLRRSQIAERLFVSPDTVKRHLQSIRAKLGVENPWDRSELQRRLREALAQETHHVE